MEHCSGKSFQSSFPETRLVVDTGRGPLDGPDLVVVSRVLSEVSDEFVDAVVRIILLRGLLFERLDYRFDLLLAHSLPFIETTPTGSGFDGRLDWTSSRNSLTTASVAAVSFLFVIFSSSLSSRFFSEMFLSSSF